MALSTQQAVSDGSMTGLLLSIDYLDRADISVYFDDLPAPAGSWGWVGTTDKALAFTPAVANGVVVLVKRTTKTTASRNVLTSGAQFTAASMDENFRQTLYAAQEMQEGSGVRDIFNDVDLHGQKIKNVAQAVNPGDAVPYGQLLEDGLNAGQISAAFTTKYMGAFGVDPTTGMVQGTLYFNTAAGELRAWDGSAWRVAVGSSLESHLFSGDGATLAFVLPSAPKTENNTDVFVCGVYQQKDTYSLSGATLTFSEAPPAGTNNIEVMVVATLAIGQNAAQNVTVAALDGLAGADSQTVFGNIAAKLKAYAASAGASLLGFIQAGAGAVLRTVQDKLREGVSVLDFGVLADGSDQTAAILAVFTAQPVYRGRMYIPYGVKFTTSTVYAACPSGYILVDDSCVNAGQPPGYRNKARRTYSNDLVNDDSTTEVISSHHPAIRLNNTATSGTASAADSYASIMRGRGFRWNNDSIDGMQWITRKSPRGSMWRVSDVLNTKYDDAVNSNLRWTATTAYALNAKRNTSSGGVWKCTTAGTSGTVEPTGTGPTFADGTAVWTYQNAWSMGATAFYYDEDGYGAISGPTSGHWGVETYLSRGMTINVDANGDTYTRDDARNIDHWRLSAASGLSSGALTSLRYGGALTGATPTLSTNFHSISNASATNMTNLLMAGGQVRAGVVYLYFGNANTTVINSGGNFNLKGNVNVTPPAGAVMGFLLEPTLSGGWVEVSRNF